MVSYEPTEDTVGFHKNQLLERSGWRNDDGDVDSSIPDVVCPCGNKEFIIKFGRDYCDIIRAYCSKCSMWSGWGE